jgi:hypothetical protein
VFGRPLIVTPTLMSKRNKYDIGLAISDSSASGPTDINYSLAPWNRRVEEAYQCHVGGTVLPEPFLPVDMWNEWLWGFDPTEPCNIECLLNRSQLLGLLLARSVMYPASVDSNCYQSFLTDRFV